MSMTWLTIAVLPLLCDSQHSASIQADGSVKPQSSSKGSLVRSSNGFTSFSHPSHAGSAEFLQEMNFGNSSQQSYSEADFKLAVYVHKKDVMKYDWGGWTNCNEHSDGQDKKTKLYCAKAMKIKITFVGMSQGIFEYEPKGQQSLKDLFTGEKKKVGDLGQFRNALGGCHQPKCNQFGFHAMGGWRKCRFGLVTNNENNCVTPDHSGGVGCADATGSYSYCCAACSKPFDTKIEVIPVACDANVCPANEGQFLKETQLPEFCEGEKCTLDECCVTTTTTTTAAKSSAKTWDFGHLLIANLMLIFLNMWGARGCATMLECKNWRKTVHATPLFTC